MGIFADYAPKYYELGLNVMPVVGKGQPIENGYTKWSKERISEDYFEKMILKNPDTNIGLLTGECSGVIGFDFDYNEQNAKELENIILRILPPTPILKIGRKGFTRFYKYSGQSSIKKAWKVNGKLINVFEILSNGRYTILPPSIHPDTGTPYIWNNSELDFSCLPIISGSDIGAIIDACDIFFGIKKETGRNDAIWAYAYKVINECESESEWKSKIINYDKTKFGENSWFKDNKERRGLTQEKFTDKMIASWLKSIIKLKKQYDGIDFEFGKNDIAREIFAGEDEKINNVFPSYKDGFCFLSNEDGKEKLIPLYSEFSEYMSIVEGVKIFNKNYIYWHNGKYYEQINDLVFKNIISKRIFHGASVNYINNYFKRCEIDCQVKGRINERPTGFINVKNGIIDIKTNTLLPHSKSHFFTNCLDVEYNKDAKCNNWIEFLYDVMDGNSELIKSIQQIFGYILLGGDPFLHKAFVFIGSGRNGKGIVLNILKKLLGHGSYSIVPLSMLDKPFSLVMLDDSIANISEETPNTINSEAFKNIVAGGEVQAAKKGKDEYSFKAKCRMIFACNDFPYFDDKNTSLNDRLFIIPFNKTYLEGVNRDPFKLQKILPELSGILNWSIDGAIDILNKPIINQSKASELFKEEYREETDPVYSWFKEDIEIDYNATDKISIDTLYSTYCDWSEKAGHRIMSKPNFGKRFRRLVNEKSNNSIDALRYKYGNRQIRGYENIKVLSQNPVIKYDLVSQTVRQN